MKNKVKIALLGGDMRHYKTACALSAKGWGACLWGMEIAQCEENVEICGERNEALDGASAVILPLPASSDGYCLSCPMLTNRAPLYLHELLEELPKEAVIVGGRIPKDFAASAESRGLRVFDYFSMEDFQIRNAYTTAEAALSIAMNSLDRELRGARVAITGFGRIAKSLVRLLRALECDVTVAARKDADLAWATLLGCHTLKLVDGEARACVAAALSHGFDVIYNTVPTWLFDRSFLARMDRRSFLIDLASAPGGVDICAAKELGSNVLWATSLPGKYAPASAGEGIAACVHPLLQREVGG